MQPRRISTAACSSCCRWRSSHPCATLCPTATSTAAHPPQAPERFRRWFPLNRRNAEFNAFITVLGFAWLVGPSELKEVRWALRGRCWPRRAQQAARLPVSSGAGLPLRA